MPTGGPICPNCGLNDGHTKECMAGVVYNVIRSLPGYQPDFRPQWNIPLNLPKRWRVQKWAEEWFDVLDGARIAATLRGPEAGADARRIVACVNACADYSTEALKGGLLKIMLEACYRLLEQSPDTPAWWSAVEYARAAITKAKGH